jgi:hypothetical protein
MQSLRNLISPVRENPKKSMLHQAFGDGRNQVSICVELKILMIFILYIDNN